MRSGNLPAIVIVALIVAIVTIQPFISGQQGTPVDPGQDIAIISLSALPDPEGDFDIILDLKNLGDEVSDRCQAFFWDEHDLVTGNRTFITQMSIPSLSRNEEFTIKVKWDPRTITPHRLWAVVGLDPEKEDVTKANNVGSYLVQMPKISGISSGWDGNPSSRKLGNFISDIPLEIPVTVDLNMPVDPSLVKVYFEQGDEQLFVPFQVDGRYRQDIPVGSLPPGISDVTINSSYASIDMDPYSFQIMTSNLPKWTDDLIDLDTYFDVDDDCYKVSGYLDIPEFRREIEISGMNGTTDIFIFEGERDILISANIMLDRTALIELDGVIPLNLEGGSVTIDLQSRHILDDAWSDEDLGIIGEAVVPYVDLFEGAYYFDHALPDGRSIQVFTDPSIKGTIAYDIRLVLNEDGIIPIMTLDMDLRGNGTMIDTDPAPGFDGPVSDIFSEVNLTFSFDLNEMGSWTHEGELIIDHSVFVRDTGLVVSEGDPTWNIPLIGPGTGMTLSPDGEPASLQVVQDSGHHSVLTFSYNGSRVQLDPENRYISSPGLVYLPDGSPMAVWTKSREWSTAPLERMGSLEIFFSLGSGDGSFPENGSRVTTSENMEFHPDICTNGDGTIALVWTEDEDSDPRTLHDNEIMLAIFSGSSWSEPERITTNSLWDDNARITFGDDGKLWITWTSEGGKCKYKRYDPFTGLASLTRTLTNSLGDDNVISTRISTLSDGSLIIGVLTRTEELTPEHTIKIITGNLDEGDIKSKVLEIAHSGEGLSDLYISPGSDREPLISWRSIGDDDIWISEGSSDPFDTNWSDPLPLTSDDGPQYDPAFIPLGNGRVLATYFDLVSLNSSEPSSRPLKEMDLSNAARIVDVRNIVPGEYKRWETVTLSVDLENIGLSDECNVYVNLDRESRDPTTGVVKRISVSSQLVQFSERYQVKTVDFNPTLVEHQLRYHIWTSSGWGDPPAYRSSSYVDLPVVSDPRIEQVTISTPSGTDLSSRISITVRNHGIVTEDPLLIQVFGEIGTDIRDVAGTGVETAGIREFQDAVLLNSTSDGLGAETTRTYGLNISLAAGRNVIWGALVMSDGRSISYGPYVKDLLPDLNVERNKEYRLIGRGDDIIIDMIFRNSGPVSHYPGREDENITISYTIEDMEEMDIIGPFTLETPIPESGNSTGLMIELPIGQLDIGSYQIRSEIVDRPGSTLRTGIDVVEETNISIMGWTERETGYSGKEFSITISNNSNRTLGIVRVALFNGFPRDDVVIAEGFITNIEPMKEGIVNMTFDLDEGSYYLSMIGATSSSEDTSSPWIESVREEISFDYRLSDIPENDPGDEEVDRRDVNDSILIGISAFVTVILISALFRRKDEEEEEK